MPTFDFQIEIDKSKIVGNFEHYTYAQQLAYVNSLSVGDANRAFRQLEMSWKRYCTTLSLNADRDIEVIFIYGLPGSGKTLYAKRIMRELGYDFCISSSSNDPFQDYLGQKGLILDDMRDTTFERLEDLLKVLDNHTSSSVKSRFANRVFMGDLIIVTSPVPLSQWYWSYKGNTNDTLYQLYRRFTTYVDISYTEITIYTELDKHGKPVGAGRVLANDLRQRAIEAQQNKPKRDFASVFEKICSEKDYPFDHGPDQLFFDDNDLKV